MNNTFMKVHITSNYEDYYLLLDEKEYQLAQYFLKANLMFEDCKITIEQDNDQDDFERFTDKANDNQLHKVIMRLWEGQDKALLLNTIQCELVKFLHKNYILFEDVDIIYVDELNFKKP